MLSFRNFIAFFLLVFIISIFYLSSFKLAYLQMLAFPLVLFVFFLIFKNKVPKIIVLISLFLAILGVCKNFEFFNINTNNFYIARFEEDNFEAKTTLIRKKIRSYLKNEKDVELKRYYGSFNNIYEVNSFLEKNKKIKGLIWAGKQSGKTQDLYLSFPIKRPKSITKLIDFSVQEQKIKSILDNVKYFKSTPLISLPDNFKLAGPAFLAELISGLKLNDELKLKSASTIKSDWNLSDHLVYARFSLATLYLEKFFKSNLTELAYLKCSLASFRNAKRLATLLPNKQVFYATLEYNYILALIFDSYKGKNLNNLKDIKFKINLLTKYLKDSLKNKQIKFEFTEVQIKKILEQSKNLIKVASKLKKSLKT